MIVKYVTPTTYLDSKLWLVYQNPLTLEPKLFKAEPLLILIQNNYEEQLIKHLREELNSSEIILEYLGDWRNVADSQGLVANPFP